MNELIMSWYEKNFLLLVENSYFNDILDNS